MTRKLAIALSIVLGSIVFAALVLANINQTNTVQGSEVSGTSEDELAIQETILSRFKVQAQADYTFDTSILSKVFIDDPRGGELTPELLVRIQEARQDSSIGMDQVGILDYFQADIEIKKRHYDNFMAELQAKELAGTLSETERTILDGEIYGWPTSEPEDPNLAIHATQVCEQIIAREVAYRETETAQESKEYNPYPDTDKTTEGPEAVAYPDPITVKNPTPKPLICPTQVPQRSSYIKVPHRGKNPDIIPPAVFEAEFLSIQIDGDIAKAIVNKGIVTTEYTLVKVNGQWYIAGAILLKFTP